MPPELRFHQNDAASKGFHIGRPAKNFLGAWQHSLRLHMVAGLVTELLLRFRRLRSVGDFGCGNGGLLKLLRATLPLVGLHNVRLFGCDWCEADATDARADGLDVYVADLGMPIEEWPQIAVFDHVLEHLGEPHKLLVSIPARTRVVIAVPAEDDGQGIDFTHLWAWPGDSLAAMCAAAGIEVHKDMFFPHNQHVVWGVKR